MALGGETMVGRGVSIRWAKHNFCVCSSAAGYYIGTETKSGFPYSRETGYMTKQEAQEMLADLLGDVIDLSDRRFREAHDIVGASTFFRAGEIEAEADRDLSEVDSW